MKSYLLTRPEHDNTTNYLSKWCEPTIKAASDKGFRVLDLPREKATKQNVEGRLNSISPELVVFNGHGDQSTITGHNNEPLIATGRNEGLLKSKIVYAISCASAKELGRKSVEAGALGYMGYDDEFIFIYEIDKTSRPLEDETARLFLEPSQLLVKSLIKGNTINVACRKSSRLPKKNLIQSLSGENTDTETAHFLWWDLQHFAALGDLDACV